MNTFAKYHLQQINTVALIETNDLTFAFNNGDDVLKNINLNVEKGSIYGFLGPNGSGKTTTIRLLLGLFPNLKNNIQLFGQNLKDNRIEILSKIGALIEQPSLYDHLSGFDNLEITRKVRSISKKSKGIFFGNETTVRACRSVAFRT